MERYCVWYSIGVQFRQYKQDFSPNQITEAAKQGWLKLDNGNIIPWGNIQLLKRVGNEKDEEV